MDPRVLINVDISMGGGARDKPETSCGKKANGGGVKGSDEMEKNTNVAGNPETLSWWPLRGETRKGNRHKQR